MRQHAPPLATIAIYESALTGVDDDFMPCGGIASFPPGDRLHFGRRSIPCVSHAIMN
jgi:hypothetical protein